MRCEIYLILKYLLIFSMIIFDLIILISNDYFQVNQHPDILIGVKSAEVSGDQESINDFKKTCKQKKLDTKICENLGNLDTAGTLLIAFICIDFLVLIFYSVVNIAQYYAAHSIISKKLQNEITEKKKDWIKFGFRLRYIFALHPVIINLACGLWIDLSNLKEFSGEITMRPVVYLLIIQCFLSLLSIAMFCWEQSSARRRSVMIKRRQEIKRKRQLSGLPIKHDSFDSNKEKTFDFELKI